MTTKLRIATCLTLPEPDVDEAPLLAALHQHGVDAQMVAWDDPDADWDAAVPTVVRSTWNYIHDLPAFLAWSRRAAAAAPLWNPPAIIAENAHKSYLERLARAGHAVVPTLFVARGERVDLARVCQERDFGVIVVKPTVSAGSFGTRRFERADGEAQAFLDQLAAERDAMVQAYVPSVEDHGERSLIFIDGELTHAMRKSPRFAGEDESVSGPHPISADERALAEAVLAPLASQLLYARVDLARGADGRPMIMELELIEPSLFLLQHPPALERLVAGVIRRLP
jgi:glutathione synthase/RimK-type ligase-like ATP-grasp enzyme